MNASDLSRFLASVLVTAPGGGVSFNVDRPLDLEKGEWWLDVCGEYGQATVCYQSDKGFGLYHNGDVGALGAKPDEVQADPEVAARRTLEILAALTRGQPQQETEE